MNKSKRHKHIIKIKEFDLKIFSKEVDIPYQILHS